MSKIIRRFQRQGDSKRATLGNENKDATFQKGKMTPRKLRAITIASVEEITDKISPVRSTGFVFFLSFFPFPLSLANEKRFRVRVASRRDQRGRANEAFEQNRVVVSCVADATCVYRSLSQPRVGMIHLKHVDASNYSNQIAARWKRDETTRAGRETGAASYLS